MTKSELFKAAHKLAKSVIQSGDDYRVTFGAAIKVILEKAKQILTKVGVTICTFKGNFLVKVPFSMKDSFKKAVKGAKWQPETKEWFVSADKEQALRNWANS